MFVQLELLNKNWKPETNKKNGAELKSLMSREIKYFINMSAYDQILEAMKKIAEILDNDNVELTEEEQKELLEIHGKLGKILGNNFGK